MCIKLLCPAIVLVGNILPRFDLQDLSKLIREILKELIDRRSSNLIVLHLRFKLYLLDMVFRLLHQILLHLFVDASPEEILLGIPKHDDADDKHCQRPYKKKYGCRYHSQITSLIEMLG